MIPGSIYEPMLEWISDDQERWCRGILLYVGYTNKPGKNVMLTFVCECEIYNFTFCKPSKNTYAFEEFFRLIL